MSCHRDGVQGDRLRDAGDTGGEESATAPGTRDEREMGGRRAGARGVHGHGVRVLSEEEAVQGEPVESHVHCARRRRRRPLSISSWGALDVKLLSVLWWFGFKVGEFH